ncbi:hypothetical protein Ppa06_37730 [Planomonospora parontospora subsp. parontospora]|uniref:Uncharacterized protein n=2 Tax=Planomonospora parontospora TaxID=58119 RepID=A0AA37F5S1_9ACTN|nr:hypothetical protein [Planomonospora parontospora]GGK77601.1 hypothetical protein GCM10010126_41170 [Planomonospora parontospora]GII09975.1 hypothetical protein Ppa06_37730 [Planomonospora parontospora subsp. parontospora]
MHDDSATAARRGRMPYSPIPRTGMDDPYDLDDLDDGPPTAPQPAITAFTAAPGPKVGGPADPDASGHWAPLDLPGPVAQQPAPESEPGRGPAWAWAQLHRDRLALPALIGAFAVVAALGVWSSTWNASEPPAAAGSAAEAARQMLPPPRMPGADAQSAPRSASPAPSASPAARHGASDRRTETTAKSGEDHRGNRREWSAGVPPRIGVHSPAQADRPARPAAGAARAGSATSSARAASRTSAAAPRAESSNSARSAAHRQRDRRSASRPASGPGPRWMYQPDPCAHYEPFQRPYCRSLLGTGR